MSEPYIRVSPVGRRVVVRFAGEVVAETDAAVELREGARPPVVYLPFDAAKPGALTPTTHRTYCANKGDADYFSLAAGGRTAENAVWRYSDPLPQASAIKGYIAFYATVAEIAVG